MKLDQFFQISFNTDEDSADEAILSVKGKSYQLLRARKNAKKPGPKVGFASVLSESDNPSKPIKFITVPLGNLIHYMSEGTWNEPGVILLNDKDWQKLRALAHKGLRIIEGGAE